MSIHKRLSVYLSFILAVSLVFSACSKPGGEQGTTENVEATVTASCTDDSAFETEMASDAAQVSLAGESENDFASAQGSGVQGQAQASVGTVGSSVSGSASGAQNQPQSPNVSDESGQGSSNHGSAGGGGSHLTAPPTTTQHTHSWTLQPMDNVYEWENSCGPDENGYTSNREIAVDKRGKKVAIYMCALCYEYFGSPSGSEWENRVWDHIDNSSCPSGGYSAYPVYAVYKAYFCEECGAWKRGDISLYFYYDYSNHGAKWIYLQPWQIAELNLPKP